MQSIVTLTFQKNLLTQMALNHINRKDFAAKVELSNPTVRKVLDNEAPLIVNKKTYLQLNEWLLHVSKEA